MKMKILSPTDIHINMLTLTSSFGFHAREISIQNNICDQAMNGVRY